MRSVRMQSLRAAVLNVSPWVGTVGGLLEEGNGEGRGPYAVAGRVLLVQQGERDGAGVPR